MIDNRELKKEIKLFFHDHYQNFGCYPIDFEFEGVLFDWDECWQIMGTSDDENLPP